MRYQIEALALLDSVKHAAQLEPRECAIEIRSAVTSYEGSVHKAAMLDAQKAKFEMLGAKTAYEEGLLAVREATTQLVAQYINQVAELQVQIETLKVGEQKP